MVELNPGQIAFVVGVLVANIGLIIGSYVSIRVSIARLEVKVDNLEGDVNHGWKKLREDKQ